MKVLQAHILLCSFLIGGYAAAEVRTITATGEYRMGDNDTRIDAKRLALLDAKRIALEQAGTYLESITEVKNLQVSGEELRAYTAGIVEVLEQTTKDVMEGATHIVRVEVTAKIDTAVVARQIDVLKKNEEAKAEMMRLQKEVERWRQEAQLKTRELAALKTKSEVEATAQARQQVLDKVQANYLLSYAWAAFKGKSAVPSKSGSASIEGRKLARTFTEQALALDPDNSAGHVILGMILLEEKSYEAAVSELRRALNLAHNFATIDIAAIHTMIGRALQSSGDSSGALTELKAAIHLAPDSAVAHFQLGLVLKERRDLERAISEFHSTLHLSPGNADAHLMLGLALQEKGGHDEAIAEFLATLRLNPEEDMAVAAPLLSFLKADQPDIVIAKIRGQLRPLSDDAGGFVALGMILSTPPKSDRDAAIAAHREALRLRPNYALAHYHLGHTLFSNGDRDGGIAEMRTALKLQPNQAGWHAILGNMLRERYYEDPDAAIPEFQEALRLEPANVLARVGLANALRDKGHSLWKKGELEGAIVEIRTALRFGPEFADTHVFLGRVLQDKGDIDGAIVEYRAAVRLKPGDALAHVSLGVALLAKGLKKEAAQEIRESLRLAPETPENREVIQDARTLLSELEE